jgi:hypothetical protein
MCVVTQLPHVLLLTTTLRQGAPTSLRKCVFEKADVRCVLKQSSLCRTKQALLVGALLMRNCICGRSTILFGFTVNFPEKSLKFCVEEQTHSSTVRPKFGRRNYERSSHG